MVAREAHEARCRPAGETRNVAAHGSQLAGAHLGAQLDERDASGDAIGVARRPAGAPLYRRADLQPLGGRLATRVGDGGGPMIAVKLAAISSPVSASGPVST